MPQATPYERKYDLTNDDGQDLRTQLDIELDDVARCFLETLTNLALIQRDDGQLANKSVGVEQLKAELIAGFNPPAPFQPYRVYEVSDSFVTDAGKWYIVNTAFTATADPADNLDDITLVYDFAAVRTDTIAAKDAAEAAQAAAELARDEAQTAQAGAETAQTAAEAAQSGAETAETGAINARNTAENARDAAELARDAAQLAETNAESAQAAAELAFDNFDDRYLGQKTSAPATDNDGNALLEGALYWDTTAKGLYVWDGTAWQANDVVALSQDASNVNVSTSTGTQTLVSALNDRLNKDAAVTTFNSVSDMKAGLMRDGQTHAYTAGEIILWLGYYSAGDGGGNIAIVESSTDAEDGVTVFSLGGGLIARVKSKEITWLQAGMKPEAGFDNKPIIQAVIDNTQIVRFKESPGTYEYYSTILFRYGQTPMQFGTGSVYDSGSSGLPVLKKMFNGRGMEVKSKQNSIRGFLHRGQGDAAEDTTAIGIVSYQEVEIDIWSRDHGGSGVLLYNTEDDADIGADSNCNNSRINIRGAFHGDDLVRTQAGVIATNGLNLNALEINVFKAFENIGYAVDNNAGFGNMINVFYCEGSTITGAIRLNGTDCSAFLGYCEGPGVTSPMIDLTSNAQRNSVRIGFITSAGADFDDRGTNNRIDRYSGTTSNQPLSFFKLDVTNSVRLRGTNRADAQPASLFTETSNDLLWKAGDGTITRLV